MAAQGHPINLTDAYFAPEEYGCGTCGSRTLVLTAQHPYADPSWRITCANGHLFVPIPGNVYRFDY